MDDGKTSTEVVHISSVYCQFRRATLGMAICKHFHVYYVPKQSAGMEIGILSWASVYFGAAFSTHHAPNIHSHSFNSLSLWCQPRTQRRTEGKLWLFRQLLNGSAKTKWTTDTRLDGADLWVVFGWSERRWPSSSIIAPSAWSQVTAEVRYCKESQEVCFFFFYYFFCSPVNFKKC